jgi:hypothetical protein
MPFAMGERRTSEKNKRPRVGMMVGWVEEISRNILSHNCIYVHYRTQTVDRLTLICQRAGANYGGRADTAESIGQPFPHHLPVGLQGALEPLAISPRPPARLGRSESWMIPGEFNIYTAILTIASALVAYAGMEFYDVTAAMAGVFVIAVIGIGVAADIMRTEAVK